MRREPGLDTLRAIAILAVVLYHLTIFGELPSRLLPVTRFGWIGVDLFFVLSGFLIGRQVFRRRRAGGRFCADFYRRRAFRILPAYLVVLAIYVLVPGFKEAPRLAPLWKFLTFTMNLGFSFDRRAFSNAWSLCVEEHFYLLLPLIFLACRRHASTARVIVLLAGTVVLGIGLRWWLIEKFPDEIYTQIYYPTYTRLDGLTMGIALALLRTFHPQWWSRMTRRPALPGMAGLMCVAAVIAMFWTDDIGSSEGLAWWGTVAGFPVLACGLALIVAASMGRDGRPARIRAPFAPALAALAYALYLTHKPVAHLLMVTFPEVSRAQGPASWAMYLAGCLGAAWLLHVCVEMPFLKLRDRHNSNGKELEAEARLDPAI